MKSILLALAIRSDEDDKCWPSIDTVASDAGVSRRCAQINLRDLEAMGLLAVEGMGGRRLTRMYRLKVGAIPADRPKRVHVKTVHVVQKRVHVTQERVHEEVKTPAPRAPEHSVEHSREPPGNRTRQTALILPMAGRRPLPDKLPPWLPIDAWTGFVDSRKKMRKPLTDRAQELMIRKLDDFRRRGIDVEAALNEAVINSWQSVVDPTERRRGSSSPARQSAAEAARESHFGPPSWHDDIPTIDAVPVREYG